MNRIALIGAGNIGSRHLQAMARLDMPIEIYVIDSDPISLEMAWNRYSQVAAKTDQKLFLIDSLSKLPKEIELAVIATNSDVRASVVKQLILQTEVKYLIMEKFLFQRRDDYRDVSGLLNERGVMAWVNCPRRMWPIYKSIKAQLGEVSQIELSVTGSNIGLGCNAIHMVDLFSFLSGETTITVDAGQLDKEIAESKRAGYYEFTGRLTGAGERRSRFEVNSYKGIGVPLMIELRSSDYRFRINETSGVISIFRKKAEWREETASFAPVFQSELTNVAIEQILTKQQCELPSYEESARLHLQLLEAFMGFLKNEHKWEKSLCPIT